MAKTIIALKSTSSDVDDIGIRAAFFVCQEAAEVVGDVFDTKIDIKTSKNIVHLKNKQVTPADAIKLLRKALAHLQFTVTNVVDSTKILRIEARRGNLTLEVNGSLVDGVVPENKLSLLLA